MRCALLAVALLACAGEAQGHGASVEPPIIQKLPALCLLSRLPNDKSSRLKQRGGEGIGRCKECC